MLFEYKNYSKVVIVGDLYGRIEEFVDKISGTNDTLYIIAGNTGLGMNDMDDDIEMLSGIEYALSTRNNVVMFVRGSIDNYKYFKNKSSFRYYIETDAPHVVIVPDFSVISVKNHNILCFGGGLNYRRNELIDGCNYWHAGDIIAKVNDINRIMESGIIQGNDIDVVVSHRAPNALVRRDVIVKMNSIMNDYAKTDSRLWADNTKDTNVLNMIYSNLDKTTLKKWFSCYHKMPFSDTINGVSSKGLAYMDMVSID